MEEVTYNDIIEKLMPYKDQKVTITASNYWGVDENCIPGGNETHQEVRFFDEKGYFITGIRERYNKESFKTIDVKIFGL